MQCLRPNDHRSAGRAVRLKRAEPGGERGPPSASGRATVGETHTIVQPFLFPSLGPTAFLLFSTPTAEVASPRNAVTGHLIGVIAGYLSLAVFGLTSGTMVWLRVPHPPAGSTTLIVSLGLVRELEKLAVLMLGVVLLVLLGFAINRLAGIQYPRWRPEPPAAELLPKAATV